MTAIRPLLASIVDYAGLFPPASLDMAQAVRNYARHLREPEAWMLGRFVLPVSRLQELGEEADPLLDRQPVWGLSVLLPKDGGGLSEIEEFNRKFEGRAVIRSVEVPPLDGSEIERVAAQLPHGVERFFEIPTNGDPAERVAAVSRSGGYGKVRTGGVTPEAFPDPAALGRFILACVRARLPFKATAGLHHPLRSEYPLTYEPDSVSGEMHGFLNVALAATLSWSREASLGEVVSMLVESSAAALHFDSSAVEWREERIKISAIQETRESFLRAFGSCSFAEPVEELKALELL